MIVNASTMEITLDQWVALNEENFGSDYEKLFVKNVLSQVRNIDLSAVSTQFHFTDMDGRTRYCDFVLQEGEQIKIAIEIDGYDKRGTGSGMSRHDFVDWQRRQAALVSQGWFVLRFANTDVRDHPGRCRKHIELLLQYERQKSTHQAQLQNTISHLHQQLAASDPKSETQAEKQQLTARIQQLQQQLKRAQAAKPLNQDETTQLAALNQALNTIQTLEEEASIMKTAIWAFTTLLAVIFVTLILSLSTNQSPAIQTAQVQALPTSSAATATEQPVEIEVQPATPSSTLLESVETTSATAQQNDIDDQPVNAAIAAVTEPESPLHITTAIPLPTRKPVNDVLSKSTVAQPAIPNKLVAAGTSCANPVNWREATKFVGQQVAVTGKIMRITERKNVRGSPTWIEIGAAYPAPNRLTLVIWGEQRAKFSQLNRSAISRQACAQGTVQLYRQQLQIELKQPKQLVFNKI